MFFVGYNFIRVRPINSLMFSYFLLQPKNDCWNNFTFWISRHVEHDCHRKREHTQPCRISLSISYFNLIASIIFFALTCISSVENNFCCCQIKNWFDFRQFHDTLKRLRTWNSYRFGPLEKKNPIDWITKLYNDWLDKNQIPISILIIVLMQWNSTLWAIVAKKMNTISYFHSKKPFFHNCKSFMYDLQYLLNDLPIFDMSSLPVNEPLPIVSYVIFIKNIFLSNYFRRETDNWIIFSFSEWKRKFIPSSLHNRKKKTENENSSPRMASSIHRFATNWCGRRKYYQMTH